MSKRGHAILAPIPGIFGTSPHATYGKGPHSTSGTILMVPFHCGGPSHQCGQEIRLYAFKELNLSVGAHAYGQFG